MITNFKNLARNSLRKKALLIAEAGYEAIEIERVILKRIKLKKRILEIKHPLSYKNTKKYESTKLNSYKYKRIFLIGIGKGSALASASLVKILGKRLTGGIALDVNKLQTTNYKLQTLVGTHPLPSEQNIKATREIIKLAKNLNKNDLLITFICGGGSALLCGSGKEMDDSILATKLLTQVGADILELNTVRKHLSEVKAGGLAKLAYPATVISLIVSDVLGNNLSMVASGPTVFDKTTKKDAERIWRKYLNMGTSDVPNIDGNFRTSDVQKNSRLSVLISDLKETPKDKKYFKRVKNILFLSNREPILAMAKKSKELGFKPKIYSLTLKGEAKNALLPLFKTLSHGEAPKAIFAGGETTVILTNNQRPKTNDKIGKGGRNMEAVLAALTRINTDYCADKRGYNQRKSASKSAKICVLAIASDGRDNTEAAGAIGDILTIKKAKKLKLNPQVYLNSHNSFVFFKKTGDLIFTKQKTFNVADLMILIKK